MSIALQEVITGCANIKTLCWIKMQCFVANSCTQIADQVLLKDNSILHSLTDYGLKTMKLLLPFQASFLVLGHNNDHFNVKRKL